MPRRIHFWRDCFCLRRSFAGDGGCHRARIVHDAQHRPIADAEVVLKAEHSEFTQTTRTSAEGEFSLRFRAHWRIPHHGQQGRFRGARRKTDGASGTAPILHIELKVAKQAQTVTVTSEAPPAQEESVDADYSCDAPGDCGNAGSGAIEQPGNDHQLCAGGLLHARSTAMCAGGHQVSWLIDGVSIPNTNIASNLGPQIDPKDIDMLEVQRGSYSADYATAPMAFQCAPRTGFERDNQAELILTAGNFYQTNDQLNFGGHNEPVCVLREPERESHEPGAGGTHVGGDSRSGERVWGDLLR